MTLAEAILAALMALPCPADEPKAECAPWRKVVAEAIADVSEEASCASEWTEPDCRPIWPGSAPELAALLAETAYHESGLRRRIAEDRCRADECDAVKSRRTGRTHPHLAHSMWQLHEAPRIPGVKAPVDREVWLASIGSDPYALRTAARAAAKLLARSPKAFGLDAPLGPGPRGLAARRILGHIRENL